MSDKKLTVKEQVDFIFSKAIEKRASFFVLVRSNKGLVVTYYQSKDEGIIEVTNLEIPLESHSVSYACMGYIRVNSGVDPVVQRGVEIIQRKVVFMVGQIEQKIHLVCIPSDVIGEEIMVINLIS